MKDQETATAISCAVSRPVEQATLSNKRYFSYTPAKREVHYRSSPTIISWVIQTRAIGFAWSTPAIIPLPRTLPSTPAPASVRASRPACRLYALFYGTGSPSSAAATLIYTTFDGQKWSPPSPVRLDPSQPAPVSVFGPLVCAIPSAVTTDVIHRRNSSDLTLYSSRTDWAEEHRWTAPDELWTAESPTGATVTWECIALSTWANAHAPDVTCLPIKSSAIGAPATVRCTWGYTF